MFKAIQVFDSLASIFSTCWMIVGSVYVYGKWSSVTWDQKEGATDLKYCNYTTYMFAFVVITIGFISLCFSLLGALCTCFCKGSESED